MALIEVDGLRKRYGDREVLRGIDLTVEAGNTTGILGPNGAGKTTCVESIGGLRRPDAGTIRVDGMDPATDPPELRLILGMQLQQCRLPAKITTAEALDLYRSFYPDPRDRDDLLGRFGLARQRDVRFEKLSGGQQQRLSVALALVGRPSIAILDELTSGLDPAARREIWDYLTELRNDDGMTVLLVTHSMEEAAYLCDDLAIIVDGRVTARGTPAEITAATSRGQTLTFEPSARIDPAELTVLPGVTGVTQAGDRLTVRCTDDAAGTVLAHLAVHGITAIGLRVETATLDDAYLALTTDETEDDR